MTGLSRFEMDKLQLGWFVMQEKQQEQSESKVRGAGAESARRKHDHKESIRRRLRQN